MAVAKTLKITSECGLCLSPAAWMLLKRRWRVVITKASVLSSKYNEVSCGARDWREGGRASL